MAPSKQTSQAQASRNGEVDGGRGTVTNGEGLGEMAWIARPRNYPKLGHIVTDQSSLHRYRTELPNLILDMDLSVYAFRLYVQLKRVAGDNGKCFYSTRELAEQCKMSMGMISKAKIELVTAKFITIERDGKWERDNIRIVDMWPANFAYFADKPVAPTCSPHEQEEPTKEATPVHVVNRTVHDMNAPVHHMNVKEEPYKEEPYKEEPKEKSSSSVSSSSVPEKSKNDDDDDLVFKSVLTAWNEGMPEKATNHIQKRLKDLIAECGPAAVIGGILAAADASGRSFKYVATCARNLVAGGHEPPRKTGYRDYVGEAPPADEDRLAWRAAMTRAKLAQEGDVS